MLQIEIERLTELDVDGEASYLEQRSLRQDENLDSWLEYLNVLHLAAIRRVEAADREIAKFPPAPDHMLSRTNAYHQRAYAGKHLWNVETKLAEAKRRIVLRDDTGENSALTLMRKSIETHKELVGVSNATVFDTALWSALDGVWGFGEYH